MKLSLLKQKPLTVIDRDLPNTVLCGMIENSGGKANLI